MPSAIHHGPPGSFKSFTLVQRFAIDALKAGRVVITNIRGLTSIDRIQDQFPEERFPESADLWFINTDDKKNIQFMAGWWHWVPFGAMVIIDECQRIYPNRRDWKKENLDRIDLMGFVPDDLAVTIEDDYTGDVYTVHRPDDMDTAFTMQRHFQWDIFLSTPHIDKCKDDIRECCESAYRHKSLSGKLPKGLSKLLGFYNTWYEFQHDPDNSGKAAAHIIGKPRKYSADERVFKCYKSTATGEHTESKADQSILGDPKLKALLVVIVVALGIGIYTFSTHKGRPKIANAAPPAASALPAPSSPPSVPLDTPAAPPAPPARDNPDDPIQPPDTFFARLGVKLLQIVYQDTNDAENRLLSFLVDTPDGLQTLNYQSLASDGVRASVHGLCKVSLISPDGSLISLGCHSPLVRACSASLDTPTKISRRNCAKFGDPKPEHRPHEPQSALVATASTILGQ